MLELFTEAVSMLPWWAGLGLAALVYLGLNFWYAHLLATTPPPSAAAPFDQALHTIGTTIMRFARYVVPGLCVIGAVISGARRIQRIGLLESAARNSSAGALEGISWQQFEHLVGESFRRKGFQVTENRDQGPDGGIDLVLRKDGEKYLVQCKQWRAFQVGVSIVRELYGVMAAEGAAGGYVVTSGRFSGAAKEFANGRNIHLIDGAQLAVIIREVSWSPEPSIRADRGPGPAVAMADGQPSCPRCGSPMERRVSRRGGTRGGYFWGCTMYPSCRATVDFQAEK